MGLLVVTSLIFRGGAGALPLMGQFSLGLLMSLVLTPLSRVPRLGGALLVALALLFVLGFTERQLSVSIWQNPDEAALVTAFKNREVDRITTYGVRAWSLGATPGEALTLSLEARLAAGDTLKDWVRSDAHYELTQLEEAGEVFMRVVTPFGSDPYLMRTFDIGEPVGGHTFRVTLELRAPEPIPAEGCRGVWLQAWYEGGDAKCLAVGLDGAWRAFDLTWTAPEEASSSVVRVVLNDFDGLSYDVRRVKLYRSEQGAWERLEPLIPQGASLQFGWKGRVLEPQSGTAFVPTRDWRRYTFTTIKPAPELGPLTATLHLGDDQGDAILETRYTALFSGPNAPLRPVPVQARQSLLFGDPNLAGHTLVTLGLVALLLASTNWLSALIIATTLGGVLLTGSRAAWLGALVGLPWLLLLGGSKKRIWLVGGVVALGALFLRVFGLQSLGRLGFVGVDEAVTRPQIWRVALDAFLNHPWQGLGAGGFAANWAAHAQPGLVVTHAHNLWLEFAAAYGLLGLVAILWLTGGFLALAWRWGRWRGLALVVPVFIHEHLRLPPSFYSGVLFPLLLGYKCTSRPNKATLCTSHRAPSKSYRKGTMECVARVARDDFRITTLDSIHDHGTR